MVMEIIVNGKRKNTLDLKSRMRIYKNNEEFNKTEILRQREIEIQDYLKEMEEAKLKYNEEYIKKLERKFLKWLEYDLKMEKLF